MSPRINERDDPNTTAERAKHCEKLVLDALKVAAMHARRYPLTIRNMVTAARFEGMVPGYKSVSIAFPTLNSNKSWCVIYPWEHIEDFNAGELADYIIDSVEHYLQDMEQKGDH